MTSISHDHKCIFVHIPRCAGTAIKQQLFSHLGGHMTVQEWRQNYPVLWRDFYKFAFVRNPWDRLVSNFEYARMEKSFWHGASKVIHPQYKLLKDRTFEQLVDLLFSGALLIDHPGQRQGDRHFFSQSFFIKDGKELDFVGRYENLQDDFQRICQTLHIERASIPLVNASLRQSYQSYYTEETRGKVAHIYRKDIDNFGYQFENKS